MINSLTHTAILVKDQQEALDWYTEKLGFVVRTDQPMGEDGRWLTVSPPQQEDVEIVLQPPAWGPEDASAEERTAMVGKQPGFVFAVDDCHQTYKDLKAKGVAFASEPEEVPWGVQVMLKDLYGTIHILVQPPTEG